MDLIISHNKCADGFCAAFIAKKRYPEAEILMLDHGSPVPFDRVAGKEVLVLDFSWPNREDNINLHQSAKSFHIYDHHKSALERIGDLSFVTFDMTRSGAGLTWDHLFGKGSTGEWTRDREEREHGVDIGDPRPYYVDYVEDRDLWNWKLPYSKEVNAYIMSLPMTIEDWSTLDGMTAEDAAGLGGPVVRHIERYVNEVVQQAQFGVYHEYPDKGRVVAVCNVPSMNCSEIGNKLAENAEFSLTWFETRDGQIQFSLRSIGYFDVSEIAKKYKGGGHRNAAGFRRSKQDGRLLLDRILKPRVHFT